MPKKNLVSQILCFSLVVALFAISLGLFLHYIYWPKLFSLSFSDNDIAAILPFWRIPEEGAQRYIATRLEFLGILTLWPIFLLFSWRSLTDFPLYQSVLHILVRVALLLTVVLALLNVQKTSESSFVSVVYLVDVSDSMSGEELDEAQKLVSRGLARSNSENDVQVVSFASSPRRLKLSEGNVLPPIKRHDSEDGEGFEGRQSDLQAALRYTYGLFPDAYLRRVVLISDGQQTRGDILAEALQAQEMGIRIDSIALEGKILPEIMIRGVSIRERDQLVVGKPFVMELELYSTYAGNAEIIFAKNGIKDDENSKGYDFLEGENIITMQTTAYEPGTLALSWKLDAVEEDGFAENNAFEDRVIIDGKPRILYVEGQSKSAVYLQRALQGYGASQGQNFEVQVRPAGGLPMTSSDIEQFSAVILSDTPVQTNTGRINVSTQQMNVIDNFVRRFGGGFIAIGGEQAFALGGYEGTIIEKILPIQFKAERKKEQPSIAMAILIDKSGSMNGVKLELAKEAAKASINVLANSDRVMIIGFDDTPYMLSPMTRAINRRQIGNKIARMRAEGGTNIEPALEMAYLELALVSARIKHVILLTDGESPYGRIDQLVRQMARDRITVSTVAVGQADTVLLKRIANLGKGRAHYTNDPYSVPQIFVQETEQLGSNAIVEQPFVPQIKKSGGMLAGIVPTHLLGYVATKAKPGAEVLMTAPSGAPILATWAWGSGRSTAFTSDVKNRWAAAWINNSQLFPKFWSQVVRATMKTDKETLFDITYSIDLATAKIIIDAVDENDQFLNSLDVNAEVKPPKGEPFDIAFLQTAPGIYRAEFELPYFGPYELNASLKDKGKELGNARLSFSHPYAAEFMDTHTNTALLEAAARISGGKLNPSDDEIFDPAGATVESYSPIWHYFVWLALAILLLDVFLRRLRLGRARTIKLV
ncbi:MAG: VWA domain-containing protein [Bradymonadales bacterium]